MEFFLVFLIFILVFFFNKPKRKIKLHNSQILPTTLSHFPAQVYCDVHQTNLQATANRKKQQQQSIHLYT